MAAPIFLSSSYTLQSRLQCHVRDANVVLKDYWREILCETIRGHSARPVCSTRLIKESSQERQGATDEHRCRRVAGGPFDLRGTLWALRLTLGSWLSTLSSHSRWSAIEGSFLDPGSIFAGLTS